VPILRTVCPPLSSALHHSVRGVLHCKSDCKRRGQLQAATHAEQTQSRGKGWVGGWMQNCPLCARYCFLGVLGSTIDITHWPPAPKRCGSSPC
jgi:hypothetical protein